jgi:hypothetical protein
MLHIFTFSTDHEKTKYFGLSSKNYNLNISYYYLEIWSGFHDKLFFIKEAIKDLPNDDIICFVDSYDVIINADKDDIIDKFKWYDCDLLISTELNCFPKKYQDEMNKVTKNKYFSCYEYLNSGGYIGYKHAIEKLLNWKEKDEIIKICKDGGDQSYFIEYFLKNNNDTNIKLDYWCSIFQCMYNVSWDEIEIHCGQIYNIVLNIFPCFIHFNGNSYLTEYKQDIRPILLENIKNTKRNNSIYVLNSFNQLLNRTDPYGDKYNIRPQKYNNPELFYNEHGLAVNQNEENLVISYTYYNALKYHFEEALLEIENSKKDAIIRKYYDNDIITNSPKIAIFSKNYYEKIQELDKTKIYDYCFIGSLNSSVHNRGWIIDFIIKFFTKNSIFINTDRVENWISLGIFDLTNKSLGFNGKYFENNQSKKIQYREIQENRYYFETMCRSNFVLCPCGDSAWSFRFYETIMCKSIPIIGSPHHSYRTKEESQIRYKFILVKEKHVFDNQMVIFNTELFKRYHLL